MCWSITTFTNMATNTDDEIARMKREIDDDIKSLMEKGISPPRPGQDEEYLDTVQKELEMQKKMIYIGAGIGVAVLIVVATMYLRRKR